MRSKGFLSLFLLNHVFGLCECAATLDGSLDFCDFSYPMAFHINQHLFMRTIYLSNRDELKQKQQFWIHFVRPLARNYSTPSPGKPSEVYCGGNISTQNTFTSLICLLG